jgi:adenylate cyclase
MRILGMDRFQPMDQAVFPLRALRRWLANQALLAAPVADVAAGFADRLLAAGIPLWRAHLSATTLDPELESLGFTWTRRGGRQREEFGHGSFELISRGSPIYDAVVEARARAAKPGSAEREDIVLMTRHRLAEGEGVERYPVLAEFREEGATDYLVFVIPFSTDGLLHTVRTGAVVTLATDRADGFSDEDVAAIAELMPGFGGAIRIGVDLVALRTALDTYLGRDVGQRILQGKIRRGSVETISAAIVFGDLRGFTALSDAMAQEQLVAMLDDYLDCLVRPIEARGGQVLKFLGDGLLATFALGAADPSLLCGDALAAALEALQRIERVNETRAAAGLPVTTLDIALHLGDVLYGNVGSDRRLDFTVIGPAVNEASRLEALCSPLGVPLIASRSFVEALGESARCRSLGERQLRGVRNPVEVFTLEQLALEA